MNKRIEPVFNIRDVNFNSHIQVVLKNMSVERPMMLQTISWFCVLRGYSTFLISPAGSGKTLGYLPAVCRLLSDSYLDSLDSVGPTCIIVCATAKSVCAVEKLAKKFLGAQKKVLSCYSGVDESHVTMSLLNGCDLLISTPSFLVKLLQASDFGIDLRRLATFVFDDCERLGEVYGNEVKFIIFTIKETLKNRINKELKVQYIVASRQWCDFMKPLAKKAPYSVVCIGAFQECVLYSKACMTVNFVQQKNKVNTVHEFLDDIDLTKKIVIVCRTDEEIIELKKSLRKYNNTVFACDSTMSIQDMHHLRVAWDEYEEPLSGPILLGCDDTLTHLNVTDANYLLVYSLPNMFSSFCRQFSVLNDNYPSIFNANKATIKIKILIEESNLEQLPKICEFIKRCTDNIPHYLSELCKAAVVRKDVVKASNLVPICDNLLGLGHCSDTWNCHSRHTVLKDYDNLKEWIPTSGITTFKILHYHSAVHYSARLLSKTVNTVNEKYPQTYSTLSLKMGLYYSKESNRKPHVAPKVGDICAVAIKQNFFVRCQVMKILTKYDKGNPNHVLINLIDEERLEKTRDIYLYYLPDDLKNIQTYVVQVRLANVQPKDKDVTFSDLATDQLRKITDEDEDLYLRSQVVFGIGNTIFVDTLEACQDLALNKTVVKHDFKHVLLERHAVLNTNHLNIIKKLCEGKIHVDIKSEICEPPTCPQTIKTNTWAYLEKDAMSLVYFGSAISPDIFFVRLEKFDSCLRLLLNEIQKFVRENGEPLNELKEGNIVLAMFPDDATYERARIDVVIDENKVNCFFVDQGDWREVSRQNIVAIKEEFITRLPFQAIECRLVGVKPVGCQWTDFSTNWFCDKCYDDSSDTVKSLYVKYFTKEEASFTEGNKYSVLMIDTNSDQDVIINQLLIDVNLATENVSEIKYLNEFTVIDAAKNESLIDKLEIEEFKNEDCINDDTESCSANRALVETNNASVLDTIFKQPIRSVLLVGSDEDSEDSERWNINMMDDFLKIFKPVSKTCGEKTVNNLPALKNCVEKSVNNLSSSKNCGNKPVNNLFTSKNCEEKPVNNSPASTNCEKNPVKNLPTSKNCEEPDNNLFTSKNCEKQPVNNSPASINCEKKPANNSPISKNCEEKPVTNLPAFTNCEVKPVNNLQDSKNRGKVLINSLSVSKNCEDELSNCSSVSKNCGEELFSSVSVSKNCGEELSNSSSVSKNCGEELSNSSSISKNCGEDLSNSSSVYKNCEEELFNSLSASKNCEEKHFNFAPGIATNQSKNETEKMIEKNLSNKYNKVLQLKKISQELDSDDLTSSESSDTVQTPEKRVIKSLTVTDPPRKPRLVWRQNKNVVSIKIILIGLQMYDVKIQGRSLSFAATLNDVDYAFDIKLYGTVDVTKSHHSNKSQYILVQLYKILNKTWLTLTNDGEIRKWIVYDAESIDASSDEDDLEERKDIMIHVINNNCIQDGSDSEDENFVDDF
ncbi:putative ATP-dependent RNA helicase TDRD12 [Battus philenor]|uniref:putative ATP-dependent RNA helicase TDRD12 n=1 Tax=Battus philenor TaxID=42288 RepID=UPI0035D05E05